LPEAELFFINDLADSGGTVLDVGANVGLYLSCLRSPEGTAAIVGFEPLPNLIHRLLTRSFPRWKSIDRPFPIETDLLCFTFHNLDDRLFDTKIDTGIRKQYENTLAQETYGWH